MTPPDRPMFTFRCSSQKPRATVTCQSCGWTVKGNDTSKVYPQADVHECVRGRDARQKGEAA